MRSLTRTYTLKKRAEQQAQTRQRIVEAAVDLHGTVGPANTTFSMVAERAGVQRHTLYAHFPDERSLLLACSALHGDRHPMPDAAVWRDIADRRERLETGLGAVYDWYARNESLTACVLVFNWPCTSLYGSLSGASGNRSRYQSISLCTALCGTEPI